LDDDNSVCLNFRLFLEDEGLDCITFESSEAALEGMNEDKFDLAIVDIMLPGMDGEEFISIAAQRDSSLRYLIHTGITNYILPDGIKQFGININDVFIKPLIDMQLLIHKITELNSTLGGFDAY
jgi:DNA-binding NtrC family response regulator